MKRSFCFKSFAKEKCFRVITEGFPTQNRDLCTGIRAQSHIVCCFYVLV